MPHISCLFMSGLSWCKDTNLVWINKKIAHIFLPPLFFLYKQNNSQTRNLFTWSPHLPISSWQHIYDFRSHVDCKLYIYAQNHEYKTEKWYNYWKTTKAFWKNHRDNHIKTTWDVGKITVFIFQIRCSFLNFNYKQCFFTFITL